MVLFFLLPKRAWAMTRLTPSIHLGIPALRGCRQGGQACLSLLGRRSTRMDLGTWLCINEIPIHPLRGVRKSLSLNSSRHS